MTRAIEFAGIRLDGSSRATSAMTQKLAEMSRLLDQLLPDAGDSDPPPARAVEVDADAGAVFVAPDE